jgi:hypothetical protein
VPLDYRNPAAGHIKLGFQWYPATRGKAAGTIPAVQGGPGSRRPTTPDYRGTLLPVLGRRNLLLANLRGTGNSSAFLCKTLQNWKDSDGIGAYAVDTGKCGRQLNHTRRLPGGGYVQASDLYTTANAACDVALLLRRVRWTSDTRVSGWVRWDQVAGRIRARLTVTGRPRPRWRPGSQSSPGPGRPAPCTGQPAGSRRPSASAPWPAG